MERYDHECGFRSSLKKVGGACMLFFITPFTGVQRGIKLGFESHVYSKFKKKCMKSSVPRLDTVSF